MRQRHLSLCTGYGGIDLALRDVLDAETVAVADIDKGACKILAHRFPNVPNLGDITAADWSTWVGKVDIVSGGTPCQDLSHAGRRAGMTEGTRSNLWVAMREAIATIRPALVVWENVRGAYSATADSAVEPCPGCVGDGTGVHLRALGRVLGDLSSLGYDANWYGLRASDVGAAHHRFRVFVFACPIDSAGSRLERPPVGRVQHGVPRPRRPEYMTLPTPAVANRDNRSMSDGAALRPGLETIAATLPTATVSDYKASGGNPDTTGMQQWGKYAEAIHRQEEAFGHPAPAPTEPTGRNGNPRLSPKFTEWLMGLPAGWITDIPDITRIEALRACGNGVVPQQAAAAAHRFIRDTTTEAAA